MEDSNLTILGLGIGMLLGAIFGVFGFIIALITIPAVSIFSK